MSYLIDGHNLIGKIRGMSLDAIDDEMQLIERLQVFCRVKRRKVEVYFDGAPPGFARTKRFGQVTAHFIQQRYQADDAIIKRLSGLGRKARNWIVVTSDRRIQAQAKSNQAEVISSEDFAGEMAEAQRLAFDEPAGDIKNSITQAEIEYWMRMFQDRDKQSGKDHNS